MGEVVAAALITSAFAAGTAGYSANRARAARLDAKDEQKNRDARQSALEKELVSRQKINQEGLQMQEARRRQQLGAIQQEQSAITQGGQSDSLGGA